MSKKSLIIEFVFIVLISIILIVLLSGNKMDNSEYDLIKVNYNEFIDKIDNEDSFILVVSQSTCSHCATYKPKLKKIASEYGINIFYIDYDTESDDIQKKFLNDFKLSGSTPTTIFIKEGKEISLLNRLEGDLTVEKITNHFEKMGFIKK